MNKFKQVSFFACLLVTGISTQLPAMTVDNVIWPGMPQFTGTSVQTLSPTGRFSVVLKYLHDNISVFDLQTGKKLQSLNNVIDDACGIECSPFSLGEEGFFITVYNCAGEEDDEADGMNLRAVLFLFEVPNNRFYQIATFGAEIPCNEEIVQAGVFNSRTFFCITKSGKRYYKNLIP